MDNSEEPTVYDNLCDALDDRRALPESPSRHPLELYAWEDRASTFLTEHLKGESVRDSDGIAYSLRRFELGERRINVLMIRPNNTPPVCERYVAIGLLRTWIVDDLREREREALDSYLREEREQGVRPDSAREE